MKRTITGVTILLMMAVSATGHAWFFNTKVDAGPKDNRRWDNRNATQDSYNQTSSTWNSHQTQNNTDIRVGHERVDISGMSNNENSLIDASIRSVINLGDTGR